MHEMGEGTIRYFGYGSLINDATRPPSLSAENHILKGWRREWRVIGSLKTTAGVIRNVCALSVREDPDCAIEGVLVSEPKENLPSLDLREARYDRLTVNISNEPCFLYSAKPRHRGWGSDECPILQSYIDCVLQGVLRRFGSEAIDTFYYTTDGWHVPILRDRDAPLYPRAVKLAEEEREIIDEYLARRELIWK